MLVFFDLETTGLNPNRDVILEVAACAVDARLEPVSGFAVVLFRPRGHVYPLADDYVRQMHTTNGLWSECEASPHDHATATAALSSWLDGLGPAPHTLAGDSVHFDLSFLRAQMPDVASRFSHRLLDVSAFRVAREVLGFEKVDFGASSHRAQGDVMASIAKAK